MLFLQEQTQLLNELGTKVLAALVASIGSVLIGILTIIISRKNHKELLNSKINEERRKEIYKQLNDFYGPIQQYLNTAKELFGILRRDKPKDFRMLTYLLDRNQDYYIEGGGKLKVTLDKSDELLLEQIISINEKISQLIVEKAGIIENRRLRIGYTANSSITDVNLTGNGLLAIAKTHFNLINLASIGKLDGGIEKFKNYVFPRELPVIIEEEILRLKNELANLNNNK